MSEESIGGTPRSFLIIGIVALLWNVMGVYVFVAQETMSAEAIATLTEAQRALMESVPTWATAVFAIAVFSGLIGCVGLLLKKAWCAPLFVVSLIAIVVQFTHWLFMTNSQEVYGTNVFIMPTLVTVIGAFLVWYSRGANAKGWLS